jgi:hypothetical protein
MTTTVQTPVTTPVRSTRTLALLAGTLFAATAAVDIPHEQAQPFASSLDYLLEVLFCLSLATSALTAWALSRSASAKAVVAAWRCFAGGGAVLAVVTGATAVAGHDVLGPGFLLGGLAMLVGAVMLAVLDVRRRVSPRGAGILLLGAVVAMVALGDGYGLLPWAAAWFAMSTLLAPLGARQEPVAAAR